MTPSSAKVSPSSRTKVDSGATTITPMLRLTPSQQTLFNQTPSEYQTPIGMLDATQSSSSSDEDATNAEGEPSPLRQWKKNIKKAKWSASTPYSIPETPPESDGRNSDAQITDLPDSDFQITDLPDSDFQITDLPDSDFQITDLPDSDFQITDVHSVDGSESYLGTPNMTSSLLKSSFSLSSLSGSVFGDGTVFKLDQLLNQIEDIKKSVVEMDADLFSVEKSKKCIRNFLTIGANDESGDRISLPDTNTTSPPSPTLEWDSDDINTATHFLSYFTDDQEVVTDSLPMAVKTPTLEPLRLELPRLELPRSELPLSRASSSGKGSSVASPVGEAGTGGERPDGERPDGERPGGERPGGERPGGERPGGERPGLIVGNDIGLKNDRLKGMIEEANKLGLVNDLLKELMRCHRLKRDSAYFEDED